MVLQKTSKEVLSSDDILNYIADYEIKQVPFMDKLWEYYKGKNVAILTRRAPDSNNPDNKIVVSYGRKIVTTFTGYGYRSKYITIKPNIKADDTETEDTEDEAEPLEKQYVTTLQKIYDANNEHIKTNRAGRNTGIFGLSYELLYIDAEFNPNDTELPIKAFPRFFTVDPREMIVLYDFSPEPKIKIAIRYYKMDDANTYKVEVYYKDRIELYLRTRKDNDSKWTLTKDITNNAITKNWFNEVPVVPYYMGDEMQSIIEPVLNLIDAYDILFSDSMNEFDRFAFAYLLMKKYNLTNPLDKKDPVKENNALKNIKRRRVFEGLDKDADIKFLTKDIPTAFIQHIGEQLKMQIHVQSHVPDFNQLSGALSGATIDRLLFDFENLVSSAEADFDVGLYKRGTMITNVLKTLKQVPEEVDMNTMVVINHKRNKPINTQEFANTALTMSSAGFSRRAIVGIMPEDIIPDIEKELEYEQEEQAAMTGFNSLDQSTVPDEEQQKQIDALMAQGMSEQDAMDQVMGGL